MRGLWAGQVGIAVGAIVVIATATLLPFNSPMPPDRLTTPASQAVNAGTKLLWLAAVLVARARQPGSPLWKVLLAYVFAGEVWAFGHVPNELTSALTRILARVDLAVLAHVLVAFPSGRLLTRFDRWVVGSAYALILVGSVIVAPFMELRWNPADCGGFCPRNVFLVWPNDDFVLLVDRTVRFVSPVVGALVLYAVWRHWRAAAPAARRSLLPVMLALPLTVVTPLAYIAETQQIDTTFLGDIYELSVILIPVAM